MSVKEINKHIKNKDFESATKELLSWCAPHPLENIWHQKIFELSRMINSSERGANVGTLQRMVAVQAGLIKILLEENREELARKLRGIK